VNDKMQVLFVKQTGHVVAAFTRSADPEGKPDVELLVGSGATVRRAKKLLPSADGGETFSVPANSLDVAVVDFRSDTFTAPLNFAVGGGVVVELAETPAINPLTITSVTSNAITIDLGSIAGEDVKVWVQIEEASPATPGAQVERRVVAGVVEHTKSTATLNLTIQPGGTPASIPKRPCNVMVLVAAYRPLFESTTPS
jgi:hypothetical protein